MALPVQSDTLLPLRTPVTRSRAHVCQYCGKPISSITDAWIIFADRATGEMPKVGAPGALFLAHSGCGPAVCLARRFDYILARPVDACLDVLRVVSWWRPELDAAFGDFYALAQRLAGKRRLILGGYAGGSAR